MIGSRVGGGKGEWRNLPSDVAARATITPNPRTDPMDRNERHERTGGGPGSISQPCPHFKKGNCSSGNRCKFLHDLRGAGIKWDDRSRPGRRGESPGRGESQERGRSSERRLGGRPGATPHPKGVKKDGRSRSRSQKSD